MEVVILAAGKGSRMVEWTDAKTKAMLPLSNGCPMLEQTILNCRECGLSKFTIVVGYRKEDIINHFKDGTQWNVTIDYVEQKNPKGGTADAVEQIVPFVMGPFLLIYADVIIEPMEIQKLTDVCMAVRKVQNPERFGVVETVCEHGRMWLKRIIEKCSYPPTNLINAGIYVLSPDIFPFVTQTGWSKRGERELTDSLQLYVDAGNKIELVEIMGALDIGTKEEYENILII